MKGGYQWLIVQFDPVGPDAAEFAHGRITGVLDLSNRFSD